MPGLVSLYLFIILDTICSINVAEIPFDLPMRLGYTEPVAEGIHNFSTAVDKPVENCLCKLSQRVIVFRQVCSGGCFLHSSGFL